MYEQKAFRLARMIATGVTLCFLLSACGGTSTPTLDADALATAIAQSVFATLTAEASQAQSTATPVPTDTLRSEPTPVPTNTPVPTETPVPTATPTPETPNSPKGDGFYTVGEEVAPGKWHSMGSGANCYWERLDADQNILGNHFGMAGGTVTIRETDYEVHFKKCGTWEYVEDVEPAPQPDAGEPKGDGLYTVGVEIAPGKWRSTGTGPSCYWARLDDHQNVLDNHFGNAGGTVTILDTDYEVHFKKCGSWEYVESVERSLQPDASGPSAAPTSEPGIGDLVVCDDMFALRVLQPPDFGPFVTDDIAKGLFLKTGFELTNLQDKTDSLGIFGGELVLKGRLDGRWLTFEPTTYGTSILEKEAGVSQWWSDLPPGVPVKVKALFDVNPAATDWTLVLSPERGFEKVCTVEAKLSYATQAISEGASFVTFAQMVNLRGGPGTNYPIVGQSAAGQRLEIVGRNADTSWWQVCCIQGKGIWVAASVVSTDGDTSGVVVVQDIPAPPSPPPTPTPLPRTVPDQEFTVSIWGIRLYDVKKAKAVYFFGDAEVALGMWLVPFVEFRNLGAGGAQPHHNLDFYLQDSMGRVWEFDPSSDGVLGAAWQFQTGHLYDDVKPGLVLGIALPFDVPGDLGDVWLRVKQDSKIVMYLGNFSEMPEYK